MASVLLLDIAGAFDIINHLQLLDTLRKKGVLPWLVWTIQSFLIDQTTTLVVDGIETTPYRLDASVP